MARRRRGRTPDEASLEVTEKDVLQKAEEERTAEKDKVSKVHTRADGGSAREPIPKDDDTSE